MEESCEESSCQICEFIKDEVEKSNKLDGIFTAEDGVTLEAPYLQLKTWKIIQMNDSVHSRLHTLIKNGPLSTVN